MNQTIFSMNEHRSIRDYLNQPIETQMLETILNTAQSAPSSINGQQMSIIVVKDQEKRNRIAELAGGQPWIAKAPVFLLFVMDYYRAKLAADKHGENLIIPSNLEGTLVGSVDVGIALSHTMVAAESLGLGTVCIGGIRNDPQAMIDLLSLPEYTFPVVGLCIGYPNPETIPQKKPRFSANAVIHQEVYNRDQIPHITEYDQVISDYMTNRTGGAQVHDWSGFVSKIYNKVYFPKVSETLKSQLIKSE